MQKSNTETKQIKNKPIEELKAKEFLIVSDVSKLVGCSRQNVYKLINTGKLKATNILEKKTIADCIYLQMKNHFKIEYSNYEKPNVLPFTKIESHNFSALVSNGFKDYRDTISPVSLVPKYVFTGF